MPAASWRARPHDEVPPLLQPHLRVRRARRGGPLTPEQALAACELLMELQQALWKLHGPQIQQAWREQLLPQQALPGLDPGEPF